MFCCFRIFAWTVGFCLALGICIPCQGQQVIPIAEAEEVPCLLKRPLVPLKPQRPLTAGELHFAPMVTQPPINTLIQPLAGTDATLEIIVGQGRLLTLKKPISSENGVGSVAIGDPSILDFEILPNPRMIRLIGKRAGATDLTITTDQDELLSFEVLVNFDLDLIRTQLVKHFPDCMISVSQMREHIVIDGQVRNNAQVAQVEQTVRLFIASMQPQQRQQGQQQQGQLPNFPGADGDNPGGGGDVPPDGDGVPGSEDGNGRGAAAAELGNRPSSQVTFVAGSVINLLRVPGVQQIMLQVRVAELNRTGLREIGTDWLIGASNGSTIGTRISGSTVATSTIGGLGGLIGTGTAELGSNGTAFGIFPSSDVNILIRALRRNSLLSILAEPNLVALSGHEANFLAGGQFPVPVPQGGVGNQVTVEYKDFGVQLRFVPHIIDAQTVRLEVAPEVSTIDQSIGTTLVQGGLPIPGIITRRVNTTVEMREGETLALAGLMQVSLEAQSARIPGLGDLPYLGTFFSNTTHQRVEKELLVMVTPVMVAPLPPGEELPYPGQNLSEPNDLELYMLGRLEGRTGKAYRSTTTWDDPLGCVHRMRLERQCIKGSVGLSR